MLKYNICTCHIFWTWLKRIDVNRTLKRPSLKRRWLHLQNCFLFYKNFDLTNRPKPEILKQPTKHCICSEYETFGLIFNHSFYLSSHASTLKVFLCSLVRSLLVLLKITESLTFFLRNVNYPNSPF